MNSQAKIYRSKDADIDLNNIIDVNAFDLDAKAELNPEFLIEEVPFEWCGIFEFENKEYRLKMNQGPDPSLDIVFVKLKENSEAEIIKAKKATIKIFSETYKEVKKDKFLNSNNKLNRLVIENEEQVFYFKPNKNGYYAVFTQHGSEEFNMIFEVSGDNSNEQKPVIDTNEHTISDSTENLKVHPITEIEYAHSHEHDDTVTSVGIEDESALNIEKVNDWISYLLDNNGTDIYRMKGIMNIHGNDERFIFQGVHMLFDGKADRKWRPDEKRRNQIIFIGKNLNREELIKGFKNCIVKKELNYI